MTVSLKHKKSVAKADGVDATVVQPSDWNNEHDLTCVTNVLLGRKTAGTGAVEELTPADARTLLSALNKTGDTMTGPLVLNYATPTIRLQDTDQAGSYVHCNGGVAGFLTDNYTWMFYSDQSGNFVASGNVTAYSDERLKKDISTVEGALSLVQQMRGVRFTRRSDDVRGIGVVAQEMQKVLPEVVVESESGRLSVAYGNLVGVLIEAVKELSARVEELEKK